MKLLLDENLSYRLVERLKDTYPGTSSIDLLGLQGQPDTAIWEYAAQQDFMIVSKDDDFRQLSIFRGHPPKVIWLVVGNAGTNPIAELLLRHEALISVFNNRPEDSLLTLRLENY